jgi:hypothetical protein
MKESQFLGRGVAGSDQPDVGRLECVVFFQEFISAL